MISIPEYQALREELRDVQNTLARAQTDINVHAGVLLFILACALIFLVVTS